MKLCEVPIGAVFQFTAAGWAVCKDRENQITVFGPRTSFRCFSTYPLQASVHFGTVTPDKDDANFRTNYYYSVLPQWLLDAEVEVTKLPAAISDYDVLPERCLFTTSCDPEIFFTDADGSLLPAFGVLSPKSKPAKVDTSYGLDGFHYADGFQAEFQPRPEHCHQVVFQRLSRVMQSMLLTVRYKHPGAQLSPQTMFQVPQAVLNAASDEDVSLGCEPSLNVYGTSPFIAENPRMFPWRMAGGHIHLGSKSIAQKLHDRADPIIRAMDAFCGVATVALFEGIENPLRRQFYGRAGEFRCQPHGLEYRALSNAWLVHPAIAHLVFNLARGAFRLGFLNWRDVLTLDFARVQHIINESNAAEARAFIREHNAIFQWLYQADSQRFCFASALHLMENSVATVFPGWRNVERNWNPDSQRTYDFSSAESQRLFGVKPVPPRLPNGQFTSSFAANIHSAP